MKKDISKAIELGKIWMKNSLDRSHDFNHALRVCDSALEIYNELKPDDVTEDMVKLVCWWHDCYKARCKIITIDAMFNEGRRSREIFEREVGDLIPDEYLRRVGDAIENHNRGIYILLNHRKMSNLDMILIEADQIDGLNSERISLGRKNIHNPFTYLFDMFLCTLVLPFLKYIHRSEYSDKVIKLYIKRQNA